MYALINESTPMSLSRNKDVSVSEKAFNPLTS